MTGFKIRVDEFVKLDKVLLYLFPIFFALILFSGAEGREYELSYYISFDVKTSDGMFNHSNLLMIPAKEEFRLEKFMPVKSEGRSEFNSKIDIKSAAKHNALVNLLVKYGLMSIKSQRNLNNLTSHDEIVMRYEGVVKYPIKILREGYLQDLSAYDVEIEALFSPIAFPDKWSFLYFKMMLFKTFNKFVSIFNPI